MMRGHCLKRRTSIMKTNTIIEKVYKLMNDIRTAEAFGAEVEDWWVNTAQNLFEYVNLVKINGSSYDEFVMETATGMVIIPIDIPCMDCHIINLYGNPRYSAIQRVPAEYVEDYEGYIRYGGDFVEDVLHGVNFIDAVKWLVLWDKEGRKNCPYDLW